MLALLRLLQCAILSQVTHALAQGDGGATACPCINPFPNVSVFIDPNCPALKRTSDGVCFPAAYGSDGCRTYDGVVAGTSKSGTPECTPTLAKPAPPWCEASWCWVDASNCERPYGSTSFFAGSPHSSLTYSYETCGNINQFTDSRRTDYLKGRTLRASFPGNSGSGYTIMTVPAGATGVGGTARDGSIVRLFAQLMLDYGMNWVEVPVSAESKAFSPKSSFTACVHEVALNGTDICVGNFWPTADRQRLASFTIPIYNDEFKLVVMAGDNTTANGGFAQLFAKAVEPFSGLTWLCLMLTVMYFGGTIWLLEAGTNQDDFPNRGPMAGALLGVYKGFFALIAMDFRFTPTSLGGRLAMIANSMTALLMVTFYAAQVTSNLVVDDSNTVGTVKSLEEAVKRDYTFCVLQAISTSVLLRYPQLKTIPVKNAIEVFASLDTGACQAGFVTSDE